MPPLLAQLFMKNDKSNNASQVLAVVQPLYKATENNYAAKLKEMVEMLETKAVAKVSDRAKGLSKTNNKRAAIQCLKRKKLYEQQIEQLGSFQLRIHDQMIMLKGVKATTETVDALKAMQKAMNIDDVDKTMDQITEQAGNMKLIQEALSAPIDEDEKREAEFEELEAAGLEEQLLQPATTAPVQAPAGRQSACPVSQKSSTEEDELAAV